MNFFNLFKRTKEKSVDDSPESVHMVDYLMFAAEAKVRGKAAVKDERYDDAWREFHKQKTNYAQHALKCGFTIEQTLALDATVHLELANILRLENKNNQALEHVVYWYIASNKSSTPARINKFRAYFNRCKLIKTSFQGALRDTAETQDRVDFLKARELAESWLEKG